MTRTVTPPDVTGNCFEVLNNGKTLYISLILAKDNKPRRIGVVLLATRVLYINRNREKHLFRANNSYGFNEHILRTGKTFDRIQFSDGQITAIVPVAFILQNGSYLHFQTQGYERQLFVTIEQLQQFEIKQQF